MQDMGHIVEKSGEMARIAIQPHGGCSSCALKGSCSPDENTHYLWARNDKNGDVGDEVVVELKPQVKIFGTALIFIFPLLGMFAGYFIGDRAGGNQDASIVGALGGLVLSFIIVKIIDRYVGGKSRLQPAVTQVLH